MRIPLKILKKMRYYKENQIHRHRVLFSEFVLIMPWYMRNIYFELRWDFIKSDGTGSWYKPSDAIISMRDQLSAWVEVQDMEPARKETNRVVERMMQK